MPLRPYQEGWLESVATRFSAGVTRQLGRAATGLGKTVFFANLPEKMKLDKDKQMIVVVHREELATQAADKLAHWNPTRSVGIEMGDYTSNGQNLIVCGAPTIGRANSKRILKLNPERIQIGVFDEAHHCLGNTYSNIFDYVGSFTRTDLLTLGVTATPNRGDGKGLNKVFQEMVFDTPLDVGIRQGWLANVRGIRVKTRVSLDEVATQAGDFNQQQLETTVNIKERNDQIVQAWLKEASDRQTVVFTVDVQHAKDLAETFKKYGVKAEAVWGEDPLRHEKLERHKSGELQVLTNCMILTEGYDDWRVACIIPARPTKSSSLYEQMVGRGTRIPSTVNNLLEALAAGITPEKIDCLVIDVVDLSSKHSLNNVATLFGLQEELDTKGRPIIQVVDEIKAVEAKGIDASKLKDIDKLDLFVEEVDLFKVTYSDEVMQISDFQWHKGVDNNYTLLLSGNETMVVKPDLLGKWHIEGTIGDNQVQREAETFDTAIKEADMLVNVLGGRSKVSIAKRIAGWHKQKPTPEQLKYCKWLGVKVPEGASKGEVAAALNKRKTEVQIKHNVGNVKQYK